MLTIEMALVAAGFALIGGGAASWIIGQWQSSEMIWAAWLAHQAALSTLLRQSDLDDDRNCDGCGGADFSCCNNNNRAPTTTCPAALLEEQWGGVSAWTMHSNTGFAGPNRHLSMVFTLVTVLLTIGLAGFRGCTVACEMPIGHCRNHQIVADHQRLQAFFPLAENIPLYTKLSFAAHCEHKCFLPSFAVINSR